jgi:hypothetical protein
MLFEQVTKAIILNYFKCNCLKFMYPSTNTYINEDALNRGSYLRLQYNMSHGEIVTDNDISISLSL